MKKVPLLDLGNVVVKVDFEPFVTWLASLSPHQDSEKARGILKSSLFYDFEFGNISAAEFSARVGRLFHAEVKASELEEKFCSIFPGLVEGMEEALSELAAEGPVYCLTNTNEIHLSHIRKKYPLMDRFTKVFASHEIRKRKPYPGIYRDVAHSLALDVKELVFFDDVHANVQGAIRAGMDAYLFESAEEMLRVLKNCREVDDKANKGGAS